MPKAVTPTSSMMPAPDASNDSLLITLREEDTKGIIEYIRNNRMEAIRLQFKIRDLADSMLTREIELETQCFDSIFLNESERSTARRTAKEIAIIRIELLEALAHHGLTHPVNNQLKLSSSFNKS